MTLRPPIRISDLCVDGTDVIVQKEEIRPKRLSDRDKLCQTSWEVGFNVTSETWLGSAKLFTVDAC